MSGVPPDSVIPTTANQRSSPTAAAAAVKSNQSSPTANNIAAASTDVDAALAARLSDLDLRQVNVETDLVLRTSPAHAAAAPATHADDNFLTLKYVRDGFCLDKKLEKKVKKSSNSASRYNDEPWLRPKLDLDDFDYDFTLERSVLRDYTS